MDAPRICQRCGRPANSFAPAGLCPHCLIANGLECDPQDPADIPTEIGGSPPGSSGPVAGGPIAEPSRDIGDLRARGIRRIGDYELLSEIARGGMGVVYKARQVSLNRTVAVKMILAGELASDAAVRRFQHESETVAQLQHPNIVAIHEVGKHAGQPYFSMDFVEGMSLADVVRKEPLPAHDAAVYLKTIAEAIHYAHQKGILHRDLKPSNILIDQNNQPQVTDFGLAKRLGESPLTGPVALQLTVSGQVLGSPNYMPPEQARSRPQNIGPASDVYSLGAILYHLLTARPPFGAATIVETLQQVMNTDPAPPRRYRRDLPVDLETICLKCLAKEPERRYASAKALAEDLGRWLRHEPILARPASTRERALKWVRRRPVTAGLFAAILVSVLLGGIAARQWQLAEQRRAQTIAATARRHLQTAEEHFASDNAHLALAVLARVLRNDPANRIATERAVNTLRQRIFFVPGIPDPRAAPAGETQNSPANPALSPPDGTLSPSGRLRLLGLGTNSVTVLDTKSGVARFILPEAHGRIIRSLAWSPDGRSFVSAAADNAAKIWDSAAGESRLSLPHPDTVYHAEFSPDGQRLVTACLDGMARVWSASEGAKICEMRHLGPVNTARFSPDGRYVLTASDDGTARLWDADNGHVASEPFRHPRQANSQEEEAPAVDDAWFAGERGQVLVQLASGERIRCRLTTRLALQATSSNNAGSRPIGGAISATNADGRLVALATGATAQVLDGRTRQPLTSSLAHEATVNCVAFSPDSRRVATSTAGQRVRLWDAHTGHPLSDWIDSPLPVVSVGFSSDNNSLLAFSASSGWRWSMHAEVEPAPAWLAGLIEGVGGVRLNERQEPEAVAPTALVEVWETIERTPAAEGLTAWARAFLTNDFSSPHE